LNSFADYTLDSEKLDFSPITRVPPTCLPVFGQTAQSTLRDSKKNTLWSKRDEHGELSTPNDRMQPAFAGSYQTVAIPFGFRMTGYLPREHPLVKNGFFGDRFVEGIYLRADDNTPCICMFCIT